MANNTSRMGYVALIENTPEAIADKTKQANGQRVLQITLCKEVVEPLLAGQVYVMSDELYCIFITLKPRSEILIDAGIPPEIANR